MEPVLSISPAGEDAPLTASQVDAFLEEAQARGLSERTVDEYGRLLMRFVAEQDSLTPDSVHQFVFGTGPSGRLPSPATAAVRRAAMMAICDFLMRRGSVQRNVAAALPRIRSRRSLPRGLSSDEVRRLLHVIPSSAAGERDRAIIVTALFTGLRRSELLGLSMDDITWGAAPTIRVTVKGGEVRLREMPLALAPYLANPTITGEQRTDLARRLFRVSSSGFAANLRRYGRSAGLGNLTPHVLRHTAAKLRREAGATIEEISAFLGHASIATTAVYLHRLEGWRDRQWADVSHLLALDPVAPPGLEARAGPPNKWPSERGNAHPADWQGGPNNGTTLPTSYSTSGFTLESPPDRGAAMSRPWGDERVSLLKSALQKYIRRGEIDDAHAVAARLIELPGGRSALIRRLPVIAAEDVGIECVPAASLDDGTAPDEESMIAVVRGLAAVPKSKEAYWLAATVWDGRLRPDHVTVEALERALGVGDHRTALAIALQAKDERNWRSGPRLISVLNGRMKTAPKTALTIVAAALRREARGGSGTGELLAAAVIAAIDQPDGPLPILQDPPIARRSALRLAWYCADGHTAVGQRALRRVARQSGLPLQVLTDLMFSYSSVRVGPHERPSRWQALAVELDARASGWRTHREGAQLWAQIESMVQAEVEAELAGVRL